jgi:hypothetical protein
MLAAINQFGQNLLYVRDIGALHAALLALGLPNDLSDLLRGQLVLAVSALDKLIHELVRIGMLQVFAGSRPATDKYNTFQISAGTLANIQSASIPPPEFWFEREIVTRHQHLAFQQPDKIADALSLIWPERHKWQVIALALGSNESTLRTTLATIVTRRNQIVHEADIEPISNMRRMITVTDTEDALDLLEHLGREIYNQVT